MNFSPADYRLAMFSPQSLLSRRKRMQGKPQESFGDVVGIKLAACLRRYHGGQAPSEVRAYAEASFQAWFAKTRLASRAHTALDLLARYIELDTLNPGGQVIEMYRPSEIRVGQHTVRVRRDVLFFGINGHVLRLISWRKDSVPRADLPTLLAPVVVATDNDIGDNRLGELQYWQVRADQVDTVDLAECRRSLRAIVRALDYVVQDLTDEGLTDAP
jgi:hypothetical protein